MVGQGQDPIEFDPLVVGDLEYEDETDSAAESDRAPNDDKHIEGIDISHQIALMLMKDKLFLAPIGDKPQKILDVGTGTGIWAIDVADEYPSAEVIGTDISAVQPTWTPPNCCFQIDDAQLDWTFSPDSFDLVHLRYLYGGIDNWPRLYAQAFRAVKPGGWIETMEIDLETRSENPRGAPSSSLFRTWRDLFFAAGDRLGRTFTVARDGTMERLVRAAGFEDVVHRQWKVPIGGWPQEARLKQVGYYNGLFIDQSLDGFAVFPIGEVLGWSFDEVSVLVAKMRQAIRDPRALPYYNVHVVYGRKPEGATE